MNNRILIASPCYGSVAPELLDDWMRLAYHCGRRMPEYEFFLGIKSKSEQFRARNTIVEAAQQFNCDRILMLDDDMIIDWDERGCEAYDFLKTLIAHDKDICGIRYYQRGAECQPVLMTKLGDKGYRFLRDDEIENGLQKVDVAGGGCLLIKTRVFDRIPFPYFAPEYEFGTDIQLCRKASEKGLEVWADTSIELGHLRNEKVTVTSRNRHQFQDQPVAVNNKHTFVMSDLYQRLIQDAMDYTDIRSTEEMWYRGKQERPPQGEMSDADSYRLYPIDRVCRQIWYNTEVSVKKRVTEFVLSTVTHNRPLRILEFGSGIGVISFALAEKGHDVTALDIRGTETLEFLKWRTKKHGVPMKFIESEGGVPQLPDLQYDVIVAMDSIEHVENWQGVVRTLSDHLRPEGMFFANNGIFEDIGHPEHYPVFPVDFVSTCAYAQLMPHTQISYIKREVTVPKATSAPEPEMELVKGD